MVKTGKVKQISLQINGLNIKLANGEKEDEKKSRSFTDQWFKLKQNKTPKRTTRNIKKKPEKQRQNERRK